MRISGQPRIVGMLGVGFDGEEGQIRITQAESYHILMGSDETHRFFSNFFLQIDEKMKAAGRALEDYSLEEFEGILNELF